MQFNIKGIFIFVLLFPPSVLLGQGDVWTQLNVYQGTARSGAASFVIGDYAYVGGGEDASSELTDFWKYDPSNDSWTALTSFPGAARKNAVAFTLNGKGYVGLGEDGSTKYKDFYSYDPDIDDWVQVADFEGNARSSAVAFAIDDIAYVGTGISVTDEEKDFWKYDYMSDAWTQIADLSADKRAGAVAFSINGKGYVSGGTYFDGFSFQLSDVQEYDPTSGQWTERIFADGINLSFDRASSFVKDDLAYICYGNKDIVATYDPVSNSVSNLGDVLSFGDDIFDPVAFSIGENGYFGLGSAISLQSSIWRFGLPNPPAAPSNLSFENFSQGIVRLFWTGESDNETGFSLERATGNVNPVFEEIATTSANTAGAFDTKISPATLYSYRVRAFNAGGFSEYSNTLELTTPNVAPTAINLSNNTIADKVDLGTLVGTLYLDDSDPNDEGTFGFVTGDGVNDLDNGLFIIDDNRLITNTNIQINSKSTYKVNVSGTDLGGASVQNSFTINVKNSLDQSIVYVSDDRFESIRTFGLSGNPIDTILSGRSIGSFDIDEENQVIYFSDQSTLSLYKSDYSGNIELLYDSIFYQEEKELIFDKIGQKIYLSNKRNDRIHEYDLTTESLTEIVHSNNGDMNNLQFDVADQTFYWRSHESEGSIIHKFPIGASQIENFQLTGRSINNLRYDNTSKVLYFISRALGVSGNDPARIASFNTSTNAFADVSDDLEALFDFNLDIENSRFFIAGETTLGAHVPTDIIRMSYAGEIEEVIFDGSSGVDNVSVSPSDEKVYWIDNNNLQRSNFDGSSLEILGEFEDFIYRTPYLVDVTNSKIVAVNNSILKIKNLEMGGDFTLLTESSIDRVESLVVDADRANLYWLDSGLEMIFRSDFNGNNTTSIIDGVDPRNIQIDTKRGKIVWDERRAIKTSNLDGSEIETLVEVEFSLSGFTLDVDNNDLYWHDQLALRKLNLSSRDTVVIDEFGGFFNTMEIDTEDDAIYFVSFNNQSDIVRIDLQSLTKDTIHVEGIRISEIQLDQKRDKIYYLTHSQIGQVSYTGDNIKELASEFGLSLDFDVFINNMAPEEIALSNSTISEMKAENTGIGFLSSVDQNEFDEHIYYLHPESPYLNDFKFSGNELLSNTIFDFEDASSYDLIIVTEDIVGDTLSFLFTISIVDNSVPTDIVFAQNVVLSDLVNINAVVGTFSTVDSDQDDEHTYSFFSDGITDNNNVLFEISDNSLILTSSLADFEEEEVTIQVTTTTTGQVGSSFDKNFTFPIDMITGFDDNGNDGFHIYPSPATDILSIESSEPNTFTIQIRSMTAKEVYKKERINNKEVVDVSGFDSGLYILHINTGLQKEIYRLIIIK